MKEILLTEKEMAFLLLLYFHALIFLSILKKIQWKNYVKFWKWNLKHTSQSNQNSFSRKSNLKFCIIFNMISFANAQGSVKMKIACSKVLLLINYFDRRLYSLLRIHYIKGNKYFFFVNVGAANLLLKLNCLKSRHIQKDHISHTKQY